MTPLVKPGFFSRKAVKNHCRRRGPFSTGDGGGPFRAGNRLPAIPKNQKEANMNEK
jgi:hypothetical protein